MVHCRAFNPFATAIRGVIGSYGNHDGMLIKKNGQWFVGEAINPRSTVTPLEDYENSDTIVMIWRVRGWDDTDHKLAVFLYQHTIMVAVAADNATDRSCEGVKCAAVNHVSLAQLGSVELAAHY